MTSEARKNQIDKVNWIISGLWNVQVLMLTNHTPLRSRNLLWEGFLVLVLRGGRGGGGGYRRGDTWGRKQIFSFESTVPLRIFQDD